MFKKFDHLTIYALALTLLSIIAVIYFNTGKANALQKERRLMAHQIEAKELAYTLVDASDYLTMETRRFAVTLNPVHLRNYWREVNVVKRRESVIKRLEEMDTKKEEFELLNQARNESDALVNTETRSQRLVLEVYEVPEEQMEPQVRDYQLTQEDRELDHNMKINRARNILFDGQYEDNKQKIMKLVRNFEGTIHSRIAKEIDDTRDRVDRFGMLSSAWMVLLTLLIFLFVYNVIQRIGTPLKDFESQLKNGTDKVELSSDSMAVIQNIAGKVNELLDRNKTEKGTHDSQQKH